MPLIDPKSLFQNAIFLFFLIAAFRQCEQVKNKGRLMREKKNS
jgi:hypothetical protein